MVTYGKIILSVWPIVASKNNRNTLYIGANTVSVHFPGPGTSTFILFTVELLPQGLVITTWFFSILVSELSLISEKEK